MVENEKKITQLLLANISEARMLVRSCSTSFDRFKPIKLKSLKEARIQNKKGAITRTMSFPEEFSLFSKETRTSSIQNSLSHCISEENIKEKSQERIQENLLNIKSEKKLVMRKPEFQEKIRKHSQERNINKIKPIIEKIFEDDTFDIKKHLKNNDTNRNKNSVKISTSKNHPKDSQNKIIKKEKVLAHSPAKESKETNSARIKKASIAGVSSKNNCTSIDGNDFIEFIDNKGVSKKLTKNQEKGLIQRLQGGYIFKFGHK